LSVYGQSGLAWRLIENLLISSSILPSFRRSFSRHPQSPREYPHPVPVTAAPARGKRRTPSRNAPRKRKSKKSSSFLAVWWPFLLGVTVTPFAVHAASIMALAGPNALMTLYPWVLLLKSPALGLGNEFGTGLSQLMMYAQFPLYGALMALILRSKSLWIALAATVAAHFAAVVAVFLTTHAQIR
jgi:hypothetical protein